MAENPMTRDEIEKMFYWNRFPMNDILIDYIYEEYHAGPDAGFYTDQDAWVQTRKLAAYFERHGKMPEKLSDWLPGWEVSEDAVSDAEGGFDF